MKMIRYILALAIVATVIVACHKIESLPDTPRIEFTSFAVFDTTDILGNNIQGGRLNFYFEDGDGDLGLKPYTTGYSDTVNLFFTLYRKAGDQFIEVPEGDLLYPSDYRIPYMEREGQNKILKGTISITFLYLFYNKEDTDTVKYEFYIRDRALNTSNTEITCEVSLSDDGIYKKDSL